MDQEVEAGLDTRHVRVEVDTKQKVDTKEADTATKEKVDKKYLYRHGLCPPLKNCRRRRYVTIFLCYAKVTSSIPPMY